jgi:hypothetical protein
MSNFTQAHVYNTSFAEVKAAFVGFCLNKAGYDEQDCDAAANTVTEANQLKRAGMLCKLVKQCNNTNYGSGCALGPLTTVIDTVANTTDGTVDLCTVEGTTAGYDVPGTNSKGTTPDNSCTPSTAATDCSANEECKLGTARSFTTCSRTSGSDTTTQRGICGLTSEAACTTCLDDFHGWATDSATQGATVEEVVSGFKGHCEGKRASTVCAAATNAIAASFLGNQGRRAGAICQLLGECNSTLVAGKTLTYAQHTGSFSRCRQTGVSSGDVVANFPVTLASLAGAQCR